MEQMIEARVSPAQVWEVWEKAHALHGEEGLKEGVRGKTDAGSNRGLKYQILNVTPGKSFSILWKTFFVRLTFTHSVQPTKKGAEIRYSCKIQGPFAWPVRWVLGKKIQFNLSLVLKAIVKQLEI